MSYYMRRCDLPSWHNYYDAESEAYVNPFAVQTDNSSNGNPNYKLRNTDTYLNDLGSNFNSLRASTFFGNGPMYKGCGVRAEGNYSTLILEGNKVNTDTGPTYTNGIENNATNGADRTILVSKSGNIVTIKEDSNTLKTIYNAPPLFYFEICGGGGGGSGANTATGPGGGGGGAASACGIIDFTKISEVTFVIGGGGGNSYGFADVHNEGAGAANSGGNSKIICGTTQGILSGGGGARRYNASLSTTWHYRASGGETSIRYGNNGGGSGQPFGSNTDLTTGIFILNAKNGGKGGANGGNYYDNPITYEAKKGESIHAADISQIKLLNNSLWIVDPVSNKVGGDAHQTYYSLAGGGGGASAFGNGGDGSWTAGNTIDSDLADSGSYGGGGGGGCYDYYAVTSKHGAPGYPGKLCLAWVPVLAPSDIIPPEGKKVVILNITSNTSDLNFFSLAYNTTGEEITQFDPFITFNYAYTNRVEFLVDESVDKIWLAVITGKSSERASEMPKGCTIHEWRTLDNRTNIFDLRNLSFK